MKVGIKFADDDESANGDFGVYDHEGALVATGSVSDDVWPGTTGLYFSEVELSAPRTEGLYTWSVRGSSSTTFGIRVVAEPECLVRIEAVDEANQAPLGGARVVMHPYRAVTDDRGVAELRVAKGSYTLFVSQTRYVTFGLPVEVTAHMTAKAELGIEPVTERN
jgi:hypothetical protein